MKALTTSEVKILLKSAEEEKGYIWYGIISVAVQTGMRRGEILGLRWKDIDLENKTVSIEQSLRRGVKGAPEFSDPKTEQSKRTIFITDATVEVLKKQKKEQAKDRLLLGKDYMNEHDLVFAKNDGSLIQPNTLHKRFEKIRQRAGLDLRFHDLRHTHITLLVKANADLEVIRKRAGHSNITTTLGYTHAQEDMQKEAIKKFENQLSL